MGLGGAATLWNEGDISKLGEAILAGRSKTCWQHPRASSGPQGSLQEPFRAHADEVPTLPRYFLLCVNYFFYGETVTDYFFTLVQREEPLRILSKYHRFISFALYLTGGHHLD